MQISEQAAEKYPALAETVQVFNMSGDKVVFWEDMVSPYLKIVDAVPNKVIWEFKVSEIHCNQLGNIHGGCVATIIDICSSFAVLVYQGKTWKFIGISTDLSVSYLKGATQGDTIRLECEVQRVGKTIANIFTRIYNEKNEICYSGSHSKFNIDPKL